MVFLNQNGLCIEDVDACLLAVMWLDCSDCLTVFVYGGVKGFVMCAHSPFYYRGVQSKGSIAIVSLPSL